MSAAPTSNTVIRVEIPMENIFTAEEENDRRIDENVERVEKEDYEAGTSNPNNQRSPNEATSTNEKLGISVPVTGGLVMISDVSKNGILKNARKRRISDSNAREPLLQMMEKKKKPNKSTTSKSKNIVRRWKKAVKRCNGRNRRVVRMAERLELLIRIGEEEMALRARERGRKPKKMHSRTKPNKERIINKVQEKRGTGDRNNNNAKSEESEEEELELWQCIHPAYVAYAKRRFNASRVRFGTSRLLARADLWRTARRIVRRTLRYRPFPRVPHYYCNYCTLASNIGAIVTVHECTKKSVSIWQYPDRERVQKLIQCALRSRNSRRDVQAVMERLPNPQWARLRSKSSAVHYDCPGRGINPPRLSEIAFEVLRKREFPEFFTPVLSMHEIDVGDRFKDDEDEIELVEYNGELVINCHDLKKPEAGEDLPNFEAESEKQKEKQREVINSNNYVGAHSTEVILKLSPQKTQIFNELDITESIPNSPELGFPVRSHQRKGSTDSASLYPEVEENQRVWVAEQIESNVPNQRNFESVSPQSTEVKLRVGMMKTDSGEIRYCALNGVGYYCNSCERIFATYSNYDGHLESSLSCQNTVENPMEVELDVNDYLPAFGRVLAMPDSLVETVKCDDKPLLECSKCHRNDFAESRFLHEHIFQCVFT